MKHPINNTMRINIETYRQVSDYFLFLFLIYIICLIEKFSNTGLVLHSSPDEQELSNQ